MVRNHCLKKPSVPAQLQTRCTRAGREANAYIGLVWVERKRILMAAEELATSCEMLKDSDSVSGP